MKRQDAASTNVLVPKLRFRNGKSRHSERSEESRCGREILRFAQDDKLKLERFAVRLSSFRNSSFGTPITATSCRLLPSMSVTQVWSTGVPNGQFRRDGPLISGGKYSPCVPKLEFRNEIFYLQRNASRMCCFFTSYLRIRIAFEFRACCNCRDHNFVTY
jgi:hypothetical protein